MRADVSRRGFVLPTTLLVMTLLTVMLAAAFVLISAEFRTTDNSFAMRRAHALAQAGLHEYLAANRQLGGIAAADSVRLTYQDGYADVVARHLVDTTAAGTALWIVRSLAVVTGPALSGQTQAKRVVATLARFNAGRLPAFAAMVAANPVVVTGVGASPFNGTDACGAQSRPFLFTVAGTYSGPGTPTTLPTAQQVLDSTHIDWAALLAGDFTPDYIAPAWPAWGGYLVGLVNGNLNFSTSNAGNGGGILVVTGNLTLLSGTWQGIILVGGQVRKPSTSTAFIRGMVVSGLNNLIVPNSVPPDSIERGLTFQWDSCLAANVATGLAGFSPVQGTWMDSWSLY